MREIVTEVEIDAPPQRVWAVLSDFSRYPEWNPFIRRVEGELRVGSQLSVRIEPPGGKAMTFKPRVLKSVPGEELRWLGKLILPGIFDGEHIFELNGIGAGERTRLVHHEEFRGFLVPIFWRSLDENTRAGFEKMNQALKTQAET